MTRFLLGLGSNLGDRSAVLAAAVAKLNATPGLYDLQVSQFQETVPVGGLGEQGLFLNAAAVGETTLTPDELLAVLLQCEIELGRVREERWGARTLDLDLLLFGDRKSDSPRLTIPHPRMVFRRFVLQPAAEIAGAMLHPLTGLTVQQLLERLDSAGPGIVVTGERAACRALAMRLHERGPIRYVSLEKISPKFVAPQLTVLLTSTDPLQSAAHWTFPWFHLDTRDMELATREILAAWEAMR